MANIKISDLSLLKDTNLSNSQILGGNCSVNFTFNGNAADFSAVLRGLEDSGHIAQRDHLIDLYHDGCITLLG